MHTLKMLTRICGDGLRRASIRMLNLTSSLKIQSAAARAARSNSPRNVKFAKCSDWNVCRRQWSPTASSRQPHAHRPQPARRLFQAAPFGWCDKAQFCAFHRPGVSTALCYDTTVVVLDDGCEVAGGRTPPWTGSWSTSQCTSLTHTLAGAGGGVKSLM